MGDIMRVKHKDIVDELKEYVAAAKLLRPGTADSNINVFALPVEVHTGVLERAIAEIEHLRSKVGAVTLGQGFDEIRQLSRLGRMVDAYKVKIEDNSLIEADRKVDKPSDTE